MVPWLTEDFAEKRIEAHYNYVCTHSTDCSSFVSIESFDKRLFGADVAILEDRSLVPPEKGPFPRNISVNSLGGVTLRFTS